MQSFDEVKGIIEAGTPGRLYAGKRVLVLTPDATRTCPLPMMVRAVREVIGARARQLDFMVAVGTHAVLPEREILALYGIGPEDRSGAFGESRFLCHRWDRPDTFVDIGELSEAETAALSGGLLREHVPVRINRAILEYDLVLILGPVFPHEVVGFSGGAKYLFPGISGGELLHFFHWLGAVLTTEKVIGRKDTPVRRVIHRALEAVPVATHCVAMVITPGGELAGLFAGDPIDAWSQAADLAAQLHIVTKPHAFHTVVGCAPEMYREIWTAGKVMYKLEQVVADGGRLVIYAPKIRTLSTTWGRQIEAVGYHVRDYFLAQMDRFRDVPRGVLAHSTHVRGTGTYRGGVERPRVDVVLATAIPPETCARVNLGYADPASIDLSVYAGREDEGVLLVEHAGETLYRLAT